MQDFSRLFKRFNEYIDVIKTDERNKSQKSDTQIKLEQANK